MHDLAGDLNRHRLSSNTFLDSNCMQELKAAASGLQDALELELQDYSDDDALLADGDGDGEADLRGDLTVASRLWHMLSLSQTVATAIRPNAGRRCDMREREKDVLIKLLEIDLDLSADGARCAGRLITSLFEHYGCRSVDGKPVTLAAVHQVGPSNQVHPRPRRVDAC